MLYREFNTNDNKITHLGRKYQVQAAAEPESPYKLIGEKGAEYALVRNKPKPSLLFAIRCSKLAVPRNWWFTDEGGTLRSLTP